MTDFWHPVVIMPRRTKTLSITDRASSMRFAQLIYLVAVAAFGALLFATVGGITHLEVAGAFVGAAVGAVIGAGLWSGRISVMTVGGILGAAFFSVTACTPSGFFAPLGFLIGYCVTFVLRGIWRGIRVPEPRRQGLTCLWLVWVGSVAMWVTGTISGLVPAYGIIFLLALEARPEHRLGEEIQHANRW